jgi:hypothetical protein
VKHVELLKQNKRAVSKTASIKAQKPEERLFFDTAGPFPPTINKSMYIVCITDDYSRFSWVYFGKMKSQIGKYAKDLVIHLSASDKAVKYLRCDPTGETSLLRTSAMQEQLHWRRQPQILHIKMVLLKEDIQ